MPKTVGYDTQTLLKILMDLDIDLMDVDSDEGMLDALKEGAAKLQVGGNTTDERYNILVRAIKHLRDKRKKAAPSAGMKITQKKISAEAFKKGTAVGGAEKVAADTTGASALAIRPDKSKNPDINFDSLEEQSSGGELTSFKTTLEKIAGSVDSIYDTLVDQVRQRKEKGKKDARQAQNRSRNLRENLLESKGFKTLAKGVGKVLSPVQSLFSKVVKFISTIIMGRIVMNILNWWSNPDNKKKIESMVTFVADWWPVFAAGFLLFGTGLGGLIGTIVGTVTPLIKPMLVAVGKLMMNPWVAGAVALGLGAWGISSLVSKNRSTKEEVGGDKDLDTRPVTEITEGGSEVKVTETPSPGFAQGGFVSGPRGRDKVPARLTAGEFVMSKGAVEKWGAGTLASMNAMGGGTNKPSMGGYQGGGPVEVPSQMNRTSDIMPMIQTMLSFPGMEKVIKKVKSEGHLEKVGRMIQVVEGITSNISASSVMETPSPLPQSEQEVVIIPPELPASEPGGGSNPSASTIPPFSAIPAGMMDTKVKVLGFVR